MSPLDAHLRDTLHEHVTDLPSGDVGFADVERRARRLHRRRVALATGTAAVVAAGAVVGGLNVGHAGRDTLRVPVGGDASATTGPATDATPAPVTSPQPTPTATGTAAPPPDASRSYPMSWPEVADEDVAWVDWPAVATSLEAQLPPSFDPPSMLRPIGALDAEGTPACVFVAAIGGRTIAGVGLRDAPGAAVAVHDVASVGQVSAVVRVATSSGRADVGLIVAAPDAGQILVKLSGDDGFSPVGGPDVRTAVVPLGDRAPGEPVAQLRVLDGDGQVLDEGPIGAGYTFPDV